MTEFNRGDIYWIAPSAYREAIGSVQRADRPGIIVSNDSNQGQTLEIVYLTTQPKKDLPTHCSIRSTGQPSTALCEQITTVSTEQIGRYLATATDQEMAAIESCKMISLGLDVPAPDTIEYEEDPDELAANQDLHEELIRARSEVDTMRRLYNELLQRVLDK